VRAADGPRSASGTGRAGIHRCPLGDRAAWRWRREGLPVSARAPRRIDWDATRASRLRKWVRRGSAGCAMARAAGRRGRLGSPAALYLAAAGVGHLTIVDDDCVERATCSGRCCIGTQYTGAPGAVGHRGLQALNPHRVSGTESALFDQRGATHRGHDVVDRCSQFAARYAVNDACVAPRASERARSVFRFEASHVFWPARSSDPGRALAA